MKQQFIVFRDSVSHVIYSSHTLTFLKLRFMAAGINVIIKND